MIEHSKPKTEMTTFDIHRQHLTVEYSDPALLPRRKTTFDTAVESLTQQYPAVETNGQ